MMMMMMVMMLMMKFTEHSRIELEKFSVYLMGGATFTIKINFGSRYHLLSIDNCSR